MKAIVFEKYGPPEVLHVKEIEKPQPMDNEVLIKIHATTATTFDCWQRSSTAPAGFGFLSRIASGIRKPKQPILGIDLAGEIEAVGKDVTRFKPGDKVFGFNGGLGAYAEYICLPEDATLAEKPTNMTYEEAAAVPQGALTALYFLRKGDIQSGQKILIFGASGGVGQFTVQLAKHFGAEVTGVCSTSKLELVKSLGADRVIDYTTEEFDQSGETYDIIFDATTGKSPYSRCVKSLKEEGTYIFVTFGLPRLFRILWLNRSSKRGILGLVDDKPEDLVFLRGLIEAEKLKVVIDRTYPMEQATEAHGYIEAGKKVGHVIISVAHDDVLEGANT